MARTYTRQDVPLEKIRRYLKPGDCARQLMLGRSAPKHPETVHYPGEGVFMVAGKVVSRRSKALLAMEPGRP